MRIIFNNRIAYIYQGHLNTPCDRVLLQTGQEYADFRTFSNKPNPKDVYDVIQEGRKAVSQEEKLCEILFATIDK